MKQLVPTSFSEWEAERNAIILTKAYRGRHWFPKLQSFAIECCQPLLTYFNDESRESIEVAQRYLAGSATKDNLNAARKTASRLVRSANTIIGNKAYYNRPLEKSLAEAALACTYLTEHSAIYATTHMQDANVQLRYNELISAGMPETEAENIAKQFRMVVNDQQVDLLRKMVGNPFAG